MKLLIEQIQTVNAKTFGKYDQYSQTYDVAHFLTKGGSCLHTREWDGFLLYFDDSVSLRIERIGVLKEARRKKVALRLLRRLQRLANKKHRLVRTYIQYQNLPSYLLHLKAGFYPTHVAWDSYIWIECDPAKL